MREIDNEWERGRTRERKRERVQTAWSIYWRFQTIPLEIKQKKSIWTLPVKRLHVHVPVIPTIFPNYKYDNNCHDNYDNYDNDSNNNSIKNNNNNNNNDNSNNNYLSIFIDEFVNKLVTLFGNDQYHSNISNNSMNDDINLRKRRSLEISKRIFRDRKSVV